MAGTFIYSPGVRAYIATERNGTLDISEDLVDGSLMRRSDGVSTFNFSIQNTRRKYDQVFTPNDRIVVEMKRIKWVRVFTGYLNSVPLLTAWPRVVSLSASCSLKRLQYWYWDPDLSTAAEAITRAISDGNGSDDAGIANAARFILKDVVGWPESKVHIGEIPKNWFSLIEPYAKALRNDIGLADSLTKEWALGEGGWVGNQSTSGIVGSADGNVSATSSGVLASNPSLRSLSNVWDPNDEKGMTRRLNNAEIIYRVGRQMGCSDWDILSALTTAIHESHLNEKADNSRSTATGLFQSMPRYSKFTEAELFTAQGASEDYFTRLKRYPVKKGDTEAEKTRLRQSIPLERLILMVQVVTNPPFDDMTKFRPEAEKILRAAIASVSAPGKTLAKRTGDPTAVDPAKPNSPTSPFSNPGVSATAADFVGKGLHLIEQYPNIRYGTVSPASAVRSPNPPSRIGCSGLVSWVLWNTTGKLPSGWAVQNTTQQLAWLKAHGGKRVSVADAIKIQGALLYKYHPGQFPGHVEISVGNGRDSIAATNSSVPAHVGKAYLEQFTDGYLLPMIDYSNAMNGQAPTVYVDNGESGIGGGATTGYVPASAAPGYNSDSSIDRLFGDLNVNSNFEGPGSQLAASLTGPRALMNDQPLMPYIMNLLHSSMRSFCSSPNGDLMAWFPDYYGLWGTAAKMTIEPIELADFYVEWSDDAFVTHQFTTAGQVNYFDVFSGDINTSFTPGAGAPDLRIQTIGIATIEIEAIMKSLFGQELQGPDGKSFSEWIFQKFGARPDYQQVEGLIGHTAELFSALYFFMRQWAYQYNANIPVTFMPEMWPGMIAQIPEYDFQAYVTAVTHNFRFGRGGGFTTTINVAAPARIPKSKTDRSHVLIGLPLASNSTYATTKAPAKKKSKSKKESD